ncbi:colicin E3/pyocin S6 family cytotoxin [Pseudomonas alliivorans]|nr:colicin E3/pyocin S6 family cytotoxin [Pseudomonas alliivorans]MEE4787582.1 colicin E3/pyocin S6 family cytotoxin [Pseudomonas alliivorans]MEE4792858.1 colicin E3/pyocin S6 family cytotoxin [Pseudomonas alliivorans]MEE4799091.1 colicin E3/pyocin S6 family cytotoxin [Pseudomonas alliivorans]MEE4809561.1 colicin E3/pyocin S6 family cytotoxin [Pseudomonas alliivorans]
MSKRRHQTWRHTGGDGGGYRYIDDLTETELAARNAEEKLYRERAEREQAYLDRAIRESKERSIILAQRKKEEDQRCGYVFSKSRKLPNGVIDGMTRCDFSVVEVLEDYGDWAALGTGVAIGSGPASLKLLTPASSSTNIAARLGGSLSLEVIAKTVSPAVTRGAVVGTLALLMPANTDKDSAFYKREQYDLLTLGRTQVRLNVKQLSDGSVDAYGFYTGNHPEWQKVPIVKAVPRGDEFVAELDQGINLIWTPAKDTSEVLGVPALEAKSFPKLILVYPTSERAQQNHENPVLPVDYRDAILVFPVDTGLQPIYVALSLSEAGYHPPPKSLQGFPEAVNIKRFTSVKGGGGLRKRWRIAKGLILEWDYQHGMVEMYNKRGKHLGEFNPETGTQTKDADPKRSIEP